MKRNYVAMDIKGILIPFLFLCFFLSGENLLGQDIKSLPPDFPVNPAILKNASPSELQKLLLDKNKDQANLGEDLNRAFRPNKMSTDSTKPDNIRGSSYNPQAVYGADLFHNNQILQLSELGTPPDDYQIGVGDHLVVSLWGGAELEQDYVVGKDGSIFPKGLGRITVQGLPFSKAKDVVADRFRTVIPSGTKVAVALGQPRSIVVQVSGNVENPGPVVVSAFTNAMNVVALAGGVNSFGNLRNIRLSRNGKIIDSVDVYKYLFTGNYGNHLYLENNDFIIVPFYEKEVLATGQFKRPMFYQLRANEGLRDLIRYAGGFTPDAYISSGSIIRTINEKQEIKTVNLNAIGMTASGQQVDEPLLDGDIVAVNAINPGLKNKVIIRGAVAYPNTYEVRPGDRLFDLINRAGGLTPLTYMDRAYVYRGAADSLNLQPSKIDVNLKDLNVNLNSPSNIPIYPNDVIELFNRSQFGEKQTVSIQGEVRKPGSYERYGDMTLKDLLYFANGLLPSAEFGSIIISRVVNQDSTGKDLTPTNTEILTYSVNKNLAMDTAIENVKLNAWDQVFVRRNPKFQLQQNVQITGEVLYQGTYPKLSPDETITSFLTRAGGLRPNSNPAGAILYRARDSVSNRINPLRRIQAVKIDSLLQTISVQSPVESEYVAINLPEALKNPGGKEDLTMKAGDVLFIPAVNPVITVQGSVQNQVKVFYDEKKTTIKDYIGQAGGFGERPWRKRIFVTYANGSSRRTKNFGFFHFYPKVESGSIITVPERPQGKGLSEFTGQMVATTIPILIAFLLTRIK